MLYKTLLVTILSIALTLPVNAASYSIFQSSNPSPNTTGVTSVTAHVRITSTATQSDPAHLRVNGGNFNTPLPNGCSAYLTSGDGDIVEVKCYKVGSGMIHPVISANLGGMGLAGVNDNWCREWNNFNC